jgi:membrane protein implicated in regulation of membrane protease activity
MYLACNLLSSILTNNAAAVLSFPIAMEAVKQTGTDRLKMSLILMLSASDYITSFGYQTNLMVYSVGGYTNLHFLRFGAGMQLLLWLSSTALISTSSDSAWYIGWIVCFIAFVVIVFLRLLGGSKYFRKDKSPQLNPVTTTPVSSNGRLVADYESDDEYC